MIIHKTRFRKTKAGDAQAVRSVHMRAFGRPTEADLVASLLDDQTVSTIDLSAEMDEVIIGHVLLSAASEGPDKALVLGPMAVDSSWRDFQIGTELVRRVLADARIAGWKSVFVLGEPDYYRRFGFRRQFAESIPCAYNIGASFMGLELVTGALKGYSGSLRYPDAFHAVE